jgi:hypothetical protein
MMMKVVPSARFMVRNSTPVWGGRETSNLPFASAACSVYTLRQTKRPARRT